MRLFLQGYFEIQALMELRKHIMGWFARLEPVHAWPNDIRQEESDRASFFPV